MIIFNDFKKHTVSLKQGGLIFSGYENANLCIMTVNGSGFPAHGITMGNFIVCDMNAIPQVGDVIVSATKEQPYRKVEIMQEMNEDYLGKIIMTGRLLD